jgi:hypothetical protein
MSEAIDPGPAWRSLLRVSVLIVAGAQVVFWLYTFRLISVNANPQGDGMEWVAIVPFGLVFLLLSGPALLLAVGGRLILLAAILALLGLLCDGAVYFEIASELTGEGARLLRY